MADQRRTLITDEQLGALQRDKERLLDYLAKMSLDYRFDLELDIPSEEESPLAELFIAAKLAADNIGVLTRELEERLNTISAQQQAIRDLSTPVLQVWEGILVLPIIGTLDTARAQQVTNALLQAVSSAQASHVLVDIQGVAVVDTQVAGSLLKTVAASRLLGTEVILSGITPEVAQSLVTLGVDLSAVATTRSLETALRRAIAARTRPRDQVLLSRPPETA